MAWPSPLAQKRLKPRCQPRRILRRIGSRQSGIHRQGDSRRFPTQGLLDTDSSKIAVGTERGAHSTSRPPGINLLLLFKCDSACLPPDRRSCLRWGFIPSRSTLAPNLTDG